MARFDVNATGNRLSAWARQYSPFQLVLAGLLAIVVVAGGVFALGQLNKPSYTLLYAQLDPADVSEITTALTSSGIPYQLSSDGASVLVPAEQAASAKVSLAATGLPKKAAVGYEALDGQPLTTSSAREKVNIQRALEGNIANTLMTVEGVDSATVQLALPKDELFTEQQSPVTASVALSTARQLTEEQVNAIVHLVASSVQDLEPTSVTVVDQRGQLLAGGDSASVGGAANSQAKATAAKQAELTAAANSMLATVLGPDKAVVRVAASLSFDQRSEQSESFANPADAPCPPGTPEGTTCQLIDATSTANETYTATDPATDSPTTTVPNTTVAGATNGTGTSNATTDGGTGTATTGSTDGGTDYESDKNDTDYALNRTITSQVNAPGTIQRLTVSVAVDDKVELADEAISALIANAVGLDAERGDTITVQRAPFPTADPVEEPVVPEPTAVQMYGPYAGGALLLLLGLGLMIRLLRTRTEEIDPALLAAVTPDPAPVPTTPREQLTPTGGLRSDAEELLARIDNQPRDAADVLRGWIADDETTRR